MGINIDLRVSPKWIPPLQLFELQLGSWHIGPQFPIWLRLLQNLNYLDLSNSGISSPIPVWFWDSSSKYVYLNFSHNHMHGLLPNIPSLNQYKAIDLSSNHFSGPVPYVSSNMTALYLSNNSFSGSISNFLCHNMHEVKNMRFLDLTGKNLSGEIPDCWMSWYYLMVVKLSNNKFHGNIPNSIGTLNFLESLHLRDNNLSGTIPLSLTNCTSLITLDFSENKLVGNIPTWIGERFLSSMILIFRANKLDGGIPKGLCLVASSRILDLADNAFSGTILSCFNNFTAMATSDYSNDYEEGFYFSINGSGSTFWESTSLVSKGKTMEYSTILEYVRSIDLSDNNLSGEIPKEITSLAGLQSLNLSHNVLTGGIPSDIGATRELQSMDFCQNQLSGEIPQGMSDLNFLSHLNLSYNKLSGRIPSGTQLQLLDEYSFIGNQLCGLPLASNCSVDDDVPGNDSGEQHDGNEFVVDWFYLYVSIAPGFVVGFWMVMGPLCFIGRWRQAYFHFLEKLWRRIW